MRTARKLVVAPLVALLAMGTASVPAPATAEVMDTTVSSDGYGTVADRFILRVNASSVRITTTVDAYTEVTEDECSTEDPEATCEENLKVRLRVWNPRGKRIVSETRSSDWPYEDFTYRVGLPGRYRTEAMVTQYVDGVQVDQETVTDTYRVFRQKRSRLPIKRSRINRGAFKWKLVGDLSVDNAPPRFDRRKRVELLARIDGWWFEIDAARTNRKGKVGWFLKPNRFTWSMCYRGTDDERVRGSCGRNWTAPGTRGRTLRSYASLAEARAAVGS